MDDTGYMEITANVTKIDIEKGEKQDCFKCPLARALLRSLRGKGVKWVVVGKMEVLAGTSPRKDRPYPVKKEDASYVADTTMEMRKFINKIDHPIMRGDDPVPGKFKLYFYKAGQPT